MATEQISNSDDVIDSRDVLERIEELSHLEADESLEGDESEEYIALLKLQEEAEQYADDWLYGAQLIRDDYFTTHIEELINDCYEMPKEFKSGEWPYRHITIDYEAAAEEAKQDYTSVEFDGVTYWVR